MRLNKLRMPGYALVAKKIILCDLLEHKSMPDTCTILYVFSESDHPSLSIWAGKRLKLDVLMMRGIARYELFPCSEIV